MSFPKSDKIWMNGKLVPWDDAKIHIGSHVIHYGSAVFEGIRCYNTPEGPAVFRLDAHTERLFNSAKIYRMDVPYTPERVQPGACCETVAANKMDACYIRPIVYRGYGQLGVNPFPCPVDVAIMVGTGAGTSGTEALETGRRRLRQLLDPHRAQHPARHGQDRRQLHELAAHQDGGDQGRLRGGHRPRRRRATSPRAAARTCSWSRTGRSSRRPSSPPSCPASPATRVMHPGPPPGHAGGGAADPARDALHRGRGVLHRHRRRDHARPLGGQDHDRQGRARARSRRRCSRRSST